MQQNRPPFFRKKGLLPLLVIWGILGTTIYFEFETSVKEWLENKASLAYGAKIDIDKVSVNLLKGRASLNKVQITNPSQPLKNFLVISSIDIRFSLKELFKKKLVIYSMEVTGITPSTLRSYSGALEDGDTNGVSPVLWERTDTGVFSKTRNQIKEGAFKHVSQITTGAYTLGKLPNLKKTLTSLKYLEELNQSFGKATQAWRTQANTLPTPSQMYKWQTEIAQWRKSDREIASSENQNERRKLAALIREKHDSLKVQLRSANEQVGQFKTKLEQLEPLLNQDIEIIKKELSLPSSESTDLSSELFGLQLVSLLEKLSFWSQAYRFYGHSISEKAGYKLVSVETTDHKTLLHFLNAKSYPPFYIQKATFSEGNANSHTDNFVRGEIKDFLFFSPFYKKDFKFNLEASFPSVELDSLKTELTASYRDNTPVETFQLEISALPITETAIRRTSDFEIKILSGIARFETSGKFEGPKLEASGEFELTGAKFFTQSQFQPFQNMLDDLTHYRTNLLATAEVSSEADNLTMNIESDFGKKLASSIKDTFTQQITQIDDTLRSHILDSLFLLRQNFQDTLQDAENISLAQMRSTLTELELLVSFTRKYDPHPKTVSRPASAG